MAKLFANSGDPDLLKRDFSKRKEFAPKGSKFFSFKEDPFSEGIWCVKKQTGSHKRLSPLTEMAKKLYHVHLRSNISSILI